MCRTAIALLTGLLSVMFSNIAWPAITIVPPGLSPGDMYQLVFVTEGQRDATSSDIAVYNIFVNQEADRVPELGLFTWFAIASTETVDARDNALVSAPVYRLDGTKVADGFLDIWDGSLDAPISLNQFGELGGGAVWAGTLASGHSAPQSALGSNLGPTLGDSHSVSSDWIEAALVALPTSRFPLYALSDKLTVPVPEPSSQACVWLMLLCTGTAFGWQRFARGHSREPCCSDALDASFDVLEQIAYPNRGKNIPPHTERRR